MKRIFLKLLTAILTLMGTSLVIFYIIDLLPYDAVSLRVPIFGANRQALIEAIEESLGLHLPFHQRYMQWLLGLLKGDFGIVIQSEKNVIDVIKIPILRTLLLNGTAFILSFILAIPIAIFAATRSSRLTDYIFMMVTATASAVPAYIIGLFLIYNVSRYVSWLPIGGMRETMLIVKGYESVFHEIKDIARHMIQPVFAMSIVMLGTLVPYMRNSLKEVLEQDYIRTAKSKGLSKYSILFKHACKNAVLPLISLSAMLLPGLIMSNIFIEAVFRWPGIGMMFIDALYYAEIFLVSAIVLFYTSLTIIGSLLADIMAKKVDPRLTEGHIL